MAKRKCFFSLPETVSDKKTRVDFVMAHRMKHTLFKGTEVEHFTMDSLMKRIMLSAVYIVEKKTYIKISFSPHHRHLEQMVTALSRMAA